MKVCLIMGVFCVVGLMVGVVVVQVVENVIVLYWWILGGELKVVGVLKDDLQKQGYVWKDFVVVGGVGVVVMIVLKIKVISGDFLLVVQIKGLLIQDWVDQGVFVNIDLVVGDWKQNLLLEIDKIIKYKGYMVVVLFLVYCVNWLYINKVVFDKVGVKVLIIWFEFFVVVDKLKVVGIQLVVMGGQLWQDLMLWEDVVLLQGLVFYKKVLVDFDQVMLMLLQMLLVFDMVCKIQGYFDIGCNGCDWNFVIVMVINGKVGMQFMGDWVKGEFENVGKKVGKDYVCVLVLGIVNLYMFNVDLFVFFQQKGEKNVMLGQFVFVKMIMMLDFQEQFSLLKGLVLVCFGVKMDKFDDCVKKLYVDEQIVIKLGGFVLLFVYGMV